MRSILSRRPSHLLAVLTIVGWVASLPGCSGVEPVSPHEQPITDPAQLYMSLTLNHRVANLAPLVTYNTLQLMATPRDGLGNPMVGLSAPTFRLNNLSDSTNVTVTADGLVTARAPTTQAVVIASLTLGPVTHTDTALIQVTSTVPSAPLDTLSIHPVPPDSAVLPIVIGGFGNFMYVIGYFLGLYPSPKVAPRAMSTTGSSITGLLVAYSSLDPAIATVTASGDVNPIRPGHARLVAQTTAYGVTRADTVTFTITMPIAQTFYIRPGSDGTPGFFGVAAVPDGVMTNEVRIAPYGVVDWQMDTGDTTDVTFDDPTNVVMPPAELCDDALDSDLIGVPGPFCGIGNLLLPGNPHGTIAGVRHQFRRFPVPGVYPFHSIRTGATGRVIVTDELGS